MTFFQQQGLSALRRQVLEAFPAAGNRRPSGSRNRQSSAVGIVSPPEAGIGAPLVARIGSLQQELSAPLAAGTVSPPEAGIGDPPAAGIGSPQQQGLSALRRQALEPFPGVRLWHPYLRRPACTFSLRQLKKIHKMLWNDRKRTTISCIFH